MTSSSFRRARAPANHEELGDDLSFIALMVRQLATGAIEGPSTAFNTSTVITPLPTPTCPCGHCAPSDVPLCVAEMLVWNRESIPDNGGYRVLTSRTHASDINGLTDFSHSRDEVLMTSPHVAQRELSDNNSLAAATGNLIRNRIGETK